MVRNMIAILLALGIMGTVNVGDNLTTRAILPRFACILFAFDLIIGLSVIRQGIPKVGESIKLLFPWLKKLKIISMSWKTRGP